MRKHGKEKRRVWRKLHLAVDAATHAIGVAESCPAISGVESGNGDLSLQAAD